MNYNIKYIELYNMENNNNIDKFINDVQTAAQIHKSISDDLSSSLMFGESPKFKSIRITDEDLEKMEIDRRKLELIEVCNTILYSTDERLVAAAYNVLFTTYKYSLQMPNKFMALSCVEDVILKILQDKFNENNYSMHGNKFSPFTRLMSIMSEGVKYTGIFSLPDSPLPFKKNITTMINKDKKYSYFNLYKFVLSFLSEHSINNNEIKFFLKKNYNILSAYRENKVLQ